MGIRIILFNIENVKMFINETVNFFRKKKPLNDNNPLSLKTKLVYQLAIKVRKNNFNNITADQISFSYKIENGKSNITIDIKGIRNKINEYRIYQLGSERNREIKLQYGNFTISDSSIDKDGELTVFNFDLPNIYFENLKVCICEEIKNVNQKCNLYFIPRNYLKNVNLIKIYHNSKQVRYYRALSNNQYENIVCIETQEEPACFDNQSDPNYVNSAYFISDYLHN